MSKRNSNVQKRQLYAIKFPLKALQERQTQESAVAPNTLTTTTYLETLAKCITSIFSWRGNNQPKHDDNLISAEFHPNGQSVWVTKEKDMRILFRQGFFGKGTLSRSEATWKERNTAGAQGISLEDITRQRRIERAQLRQQKQQQQQQNQNKQNSNGSNTAIDISSPGPLSTPQTIPSPSISNANKLQGASSISIDEDENYEHLQLSLEEAFFLVFAIECISIKSAADPRSGLNQTMSIQSCWLQFAQASAIHQANSASSPLSTVYDISPYNPFITRYTVYHYYRSQGWIVKDGLKYGSDFLLYQKGPVFGHSQYAVKIVPYSSNRENMEFNDSSMTHTPTCSPISPTPGLYGDIVLCAGSGKCYKAAALTSKNSTATV
ncbi:tRNA splicing endonuclease subunit sen2 [Entomortierella beljakovae]|nr:tRNA splicing endonuclease subunit sen2 [Entomortierella beljakovae]